MTTRQQSCFELAFEDRGAVFHSGERFLRLQFVTPSIVRITFTEGKPFLQRASRIVLAEQCGGAYEFREDQTCYVLATEAMRVEVRKDSGAIAYFNARGELLMREPERGGKWLTRKPVTRNVFDADDAVELGQSIDGARATASKYETVFDREAFEAKLEFQFAEDEALFGLGSHEEGYANLRGRCRELYQQNMKAVVPHLVSTRGYGVLLDCTSLMTFHDDGLGSYWWADCVEELDFFVIAGESYDDVVRGYRHLTGTPPMLPKWAVGYVQSKERYVTAAELLAVVAEYRRRQIPLDCIVLDWKSWPNGGGWGQKSFDPQRFPDPTVLTEELHAMGAKLMVSIWPIMTGGCADQRELLDRGLMLGNKSTYNAFLPEARATYWKQADAGLFSQGIDGWWCDCTEPFEADWAGAVKPEQHARLAINTNESKLYLDAGNLNAYSLVHSQGIYDGQRATTETKRVLNLTRSAYAGQSRYGTVTWNGDTCGTWDTLRRGVAEGLNFFATGEAYWTVDAGGFFLDYNPDLWFWRGDYPEGCRGLTDMDALEPDPNDTGCRDRGFWELYTRWMQYAAFLPMFRSHGTDAAREIWRFGDEGSIFYDAIAETIRMRYRLLPYIYSVAAGVTFRGECMVRALGLMFPKDLATHAVADQYMFGQALMVCPVTKPMLFERGSRALEGVEQARGVYLPAGPGWYDFCTGEFCRGGQTWRAGAALSRIPVFALAGSIVPMGPVTQFVDEVPDAAWDLRIYTGTDAVFTLYEDAGDGYAYERGEYSRVELRWDERNRELTINAREGSFPGMVPERECRVTLYGQHGVQQHLIHYRGLQVRIAADPEKELH